jgi:hypothetical protein
MDKVNESLERLWKIMSSTGHHYEEHTEIVGSWCAQWDENPEYDSYIANDVELFVQGNMLFLIPKEDSKPIKLIIA